MTAEENSSQREAISQTPRSSTRSFVNPGVPPIKPIPSIRNVMGEVKPVEEEKAPKTEDLSEILVEEETPETPVQEEAAIAAPEVVSETDEIEYEEVVDEEPDEKDDDDEGDGEGEETALSADSSSEKDESPDAGKTDKENGEDFATCWHRLFETLFSDKHLIYYSLKDETPRYENDVIYIEVKNGIQKDLIETSKTAILEYWRNHFTLNVDDLEVTANEQKESKKVIVNAEDKMRNMAEQNDQLMDFLKILKLNIKD